MKKKIVTIVEPKLVETVKELQDLLKQFREIPSELPKVVNRMVMHDEISDEGLQDIEELAMFLNTEFPNRKLKGYRNSNIYKELVKLHPCDKTFMIMKVLYLIDTKVQIEITPPVQTHEIVINLITPPDTAQYNADLIEAIKTTITNLLIEDKVMNIIKSEPILLFDYKTSSLTINCETSLSEEQLRIKVENTINDMCNAVSVDNIFIHKESNIVRFPVEQDLSIGTINDIVDIIKNGYTFCIKDFHFDYETNTFILEFKGDNTTAKELVKINVENCLTMMV